MNIEEIENKLKLLEFHQKLLLELIRPSSDAFTALIIEKGMSEEEVKQLLDLCDDLSIKMEEQKEEGFVYFYSLYEKFTQALKPNQTPTEVVNACLQQGIQGELMNEFKKYLDR